MTQGYLKMKTAGRRAIGDDQKAERRETILQTAWEMFQASTYEAVTIAGVAGQLGLAKGTVFLYFPTKDELFLAVQAQQMEAWFDGIDARLAKLAVPCEAEAFAQVIAKSLKSNTQFVRLLAILSTVLEQNIGLDSAIRFKHMLLRRLTSTGMRIEQHLPWLQAGEGARVLMRIQAIVVGLWHQADTSAVVTEALRDKTLRGLTVNFHRELPAMLIALLQGMERDGRTAMNTD